MSLVKKNHASVEQRTSSPPAPAHRAPARHGEGPAPASSINKTSSPVLPPTANNKKKPASLTADAATVALDASLVAAPIKDTTTFTTAAPAASLHSVISEIHEAAQDLRQKSPGHFSVVRGNRSINSAQFCAAIGLKSSDERVTVESIDNEAEGSVQITAPMFGDVSYLAEIAAAVFAQSKARAAVV